MKRNTWFNVLIKVVVIVIVFSGLHKSQLIVSSLEKFDIGYLTSFKNLNLKEIVNVPLHLVSTNDSSTLLVHQISSAERPLEEQQTNQAKKKSIYIYNTHQYETYEGGSVMDGARYLKTKLEELGYEVIVEENDFEAYKRNNNMDLTETYPTSRIFLEKQLASHGPFDLIIDFHRDAISKEASTYQNYAKMMMVISMTATFHEEVEANSAVIREAVETIQPGIMRSDFKREYAYFNQQYAHSMVLIEIGAQYNTFDEVKNSLDVLALAIDESLKGDKIQ